MNFLPADIEKYVEQHAEAESELLSRLSRETWQKVLNPRMLSGHVQGRFLSMISHLMRPKFILEIGTYTGYSALCLAEGLQADGVLDTIDINDELKWIQEKYFSESPDGNKIRRHTGKAVDIIPQLKQVYDLVFIDADKESYILYYNMLVDMLRPGGLMLVDNVLWSGKVLNEADPNDLETTTLRELNEIVRDDVRVQNVLLPLRDGVMMVRKK